MLGAQGLQDHLYSLLVVLYGRAALISVPRLPGGVVAIRTGLILLRYWRNSENITETSSTITLSVLVLDLVEAVSDELELLPLQVLGLVTLEGLAVEPLHLAPEALDAVVLRVVGLVEDELDALFFHKLLRPLALVDLAVVQEDVPLLAGASQPRLHHLLQLAEELDERVLSGGLQGLRNEYLAKDGIHGADAGHASPIPVLLLQLYLLPLKLVDPRVVRLRAEGALVDEDEDVASPQDPLHLASDPRHVLEALAALIFQRPVQLDQLSTSDAQSMVHPTQIS